MQPKLIWYTAYGSNMSSERFRCYLKGGRPRGATRTNPGARDQAPPRQTRPVWLPGVMYFAGHSPVWNGAPAFYAPSAPGRVAARAYLITPQQFGDVLAQEMHRPPGGHFVLPQFSATNRVQLGSGRYETLVRTGNIDTYPSVTFTTSSDIADADLAPPSAAYLQVIGSGLIEGHGWSPAQAASYLASCPGAKGSWQADHIEQLLTTSASRLPAD